jgi:AAA15 family ATPase/GTPase
LTIFNSIKLNAFGRHSQCNWTEHGQINLLIGENDSGKTQLLKLLYSIAKSLDSYSQNQSSTKEPWHTSLAEKLLNTLQPDNFGQN